MLGMDEFCLKQSRYEYEAKCVDFHTAIVLGKWVRESNEEGKATNFTFSTHFCPLTNVGLSAEGAKTPIYLKIFEGKRRRRENLKIVASERRKREETHWS